MAKMNWARPNSENSQDLQVKDLMTSEPIVVERSTTLERAEALMREKKIRHLPVVNEHGELVGLLTHRDVLRFSVSELSELSVLDRDVVHGEIPVGELIRSEVSAVTPKTSVKTAAILMAEKKYGCLPVTEGSRLVGIVTEGDFLRFFADGM